MSMRELKVEDALLYLDQVKQEFGDQPQIYNEFLDIMKTFKTQQIDTPGVIQRVSSLFRGNRRLVLGFNTFLPEGYKIELPEGRDGPAIAVYRAPGSTISHVLTGPTASAPPQPPPPQARVHPPQPPMRQTSRQIAHPPPPPQQRVGPPQPQRAEAPPPQNYPTMAAASTAGIHGGAPSLRAGQPPHEPPRPRGHGAMDQAPTRPGMVRGQPPQQPPPAQTAEAVDQQPTPRGAPLGAGAGPPQQKSMNGQPGAAKLSGPGNGPAYDPTAQTDQQQPQQPPPGGQQQQTPGPLPQQQGPLEFDHAINYVTTIKKRFSTEPYTYKKFLEILHTYQKEQRGIKEVLDEVSTLFSEHPDLLKEFTYFLPDAVQAQAKAQLDAVAKEAEIRKRNKERLNAGMGQPGRQGGGPRGGSAAGGAAARAPAEYDRDSVPVPFAPSQGRSPEHENSIIRGAHFGIVSFAPVRPPRNSQPTPAQAAQQKGRPTAIPKLPISPNTTETAFFQRAKEHLNRKELASDKPSAVKRHTPYTEFLKCLHLFGAGILNKDELVLLLKGLFMQGHAPKSGANASGGNFNPSIAHDANELLREFEEVLIGRGSYADQEAEFKDKSKYGGMHAREFDFGGCDNPTPSYHAYPSDYPKNLFLSYPGQTETDSTSLNTNMVCVGPQNGTALSMEDSEGWKKRHNSYEEAMFRIEDERYEVDMAIERNAQAMRQIEPFAEEVQALREQEEKDGQPIGRLQYELNRYAMNTIHINAIGRIYGDRGDEVLQHLAQNPFIVLPIIYQRLKQKDMEWRKAKAALLPKWGAAAEANYEGTLDTLCYFRRREFEKAFSPKGILDECRRAHTYCKHPERIRTNPTAAPFIPKFKRSSSDSGAMLYQPHAVVKCPLTVAHKDALQLITYRVKEITAARPLDRERVSRIVAEFLVPWYAYPAYWVAEEARSAFQGCDNPSVVKYALGQRVVTLFGTGTILSFHEKTSTAGPKYRVRLAYGIAFLSPAAVLHAVPSRDTPYVRRDGAMVREPSLEIAPAGAAKLGKKYEILFGTEKIYVFLRLHSLICSIMSDIRSYREKHGPSADPSEKYYRPLKKDNAASGAVHNCDHRAGLAAVQKAVSKAIGPKELETIGRRVCKDKVHLIVALPKLVERCAEALAAVAGEDCLLNLFDYCQYRQASPVSLRALCFTVDPAAVFRVQHDTSGGTLYFNYLPKAKDLTIVQKGENGTIEEDANGDDGSMPMEVEDDPVEDSENDARPMKRARVT